MRSTSYKAPYVQVLANLTELLPEFTYRLELFILGQQASQASSLVLSEGHCPVRQMRSELELASHLVVQQPATVYHVPAQ